MAAGVSRANDSGGMRLRRKRVGRVSVARVAPDASVHVPLLHAALSATSQYDAGRSFTGES